MKKRKKKKNIDEINDKNIKKKQNINQDYLKKVLKK